MQNLGDSKSPAMFYHLENQKNDDITVASIQSAEGRVNVYVSVVRSVKHPLFSLLKVASVPSECLLSFVRLSKRFYQCVNELSQLPVFFAEQDIVINVYRGRLPSTDLHVGEEVI